MKSFQEYVIFAFQFDDSRTLLYGLSALAFFTALQITPNASLAFAMYAFSGVLTVVLAIILLKEKDYLSRKIVGAVLSLVGLLLTNK